MLIIFYSLKSSLKVHHQRRTRLYFAHAFDEWLRPRRDYGRFQIGSPRFFQRCNSVWATTRFHCTGTLHPVSTAALRAKSMFRFSIPKAALLDGVLDPGHVYNDNLQCALRICQIRLLDAATANLPPSNIGTGYEKEVSSGTSRSMDLACRRRMMFFVSLSPGRRIVPKEIVSIQKFRIPLKILSRGAQDVSTMSRLIICCGQAVMPTPSNK